MARQTRRWDDYFSSLYKAYEQTLEMLLNSVTMDVQPCGRSKMNSSFLTGGRKAPWRKVKTTAICIRSVNSIHDPLSSTHTLHLLRKTELPRR